MIGHCRQYRKPDVSLSDMGMAVFMGAEGIQAVVDVDDFQSVDADDAVKFRKQAVQIGSDVVATVPSAMSSMSFSRPCPT